MARVNGDLIAFPTFEQLAVADIDLMVACSKDAVVMVEGGAAEASEADVVEALMFARQAALPIIELIERMRAAVGKEKRPFEPKKLPEEIARRVAAIVDAGILECSLIKDKKARYDGYKAGKEAMVATLTTELGPEKFAEHEKLIRAEFDERKYEVVRGYVLGQKKRIDGRDMVTVRPVATEVGILPRVHGSALFQRGETQAVVTTTLGTSSDEQKIDALTGERWKRFLLHYNFPPFSTGETKPMRGPGRREIGHGALAERALSRMIPEPEKFPYTIRIVSETLESNGSSSMAAVCGGTLSLMDAGVPIKAPVAGIAMGLISDGKRTAILTDILGDEDHLGDMDFKVCGTSRGITAIQMDIKIAGLSREVMTQALAQARDGRMFILGKMMETLKRAARGALQVRAAHHHHQGEAGPDPPRHRPGRQDHQGDHRPDGRGDRRRGRRHGQRRVVRRGRRQEGARHHQGADRGARGRGRLQGGGPARDRLRRLRRAVAGDRRAAPHLRDGPHNGSRTSPT